MLKKILLVLAALVVVVLIIAATRPAAFRYSRTAVISAPPEAVFAHVNDLHKWVVWSPFEKGDPAMKREFSGAPSGEGAVYYWSGNMQVGEGRATITESRPGELIRFRLDFVRPFAGTNTAEFTFRPQGAQTTVTWSLAGENSYACRVIGVFMNMEKMVGGQFDEGLAALKKIVETPDGK